MCAFGKVRSIRGRAFLQHFTLINTVRKRLFNTDTYRYICFYWNCNTHFSTLTVQ